ncbi:hypothetical protein Tco_0797019 [Tanacetum coccineum]
MSIPNRAEEKTTKVPALDHSQLTVTRVDDEEPRRMTRLVSELLKADYRRQRQLAETLKIVKSLKAQMTELQRQQGPAKDPAEPEEAENGTKRKAHKNHEGKASHRDCIPHHHRHYSPPVTTTPPRSQDPRLPQLRCTNALTAGHDHEVQKEVVSLTQCLEMYGNYVSIVTATVENKVKFATCTLMGTALTWWNSHARTVTNEVAYAMTWSDLKEEDGQLNIVRGM